MDNNQPQLILAAGGIVERAAPGEPQIAVIYRERYGGEWNIPKGKLEPGESPMSAAIREVKEETGCTASITGFAGVNHYYHDQNPKVVVYWRMKANGDSVFQSSEEVRTMAWLSPQDAVARLTHQDEKDLVTSVYGSESGQKVHQGPRLTLRLRRLWSRLFGAPQYDRLKNALDEYEIRLRHRISNQPSDSTRPWAVAAQKGVARGRQALNQLCFDNGWQHLLTSQSFEIWGYSDAEVLTERAVVCREAAKLSGWRKETIDSLVCTRAGQTADAELLRRQLYQATVVRNEHFINLYHKIRVRGRSLKVSFLILSLVVVGVPLLTRAFWHNTVDWKVIVAIELTGIFGAALSVASALTRSSVDASIPQQTLASVVTWMRPLIGAGAALAACLLFQAGLLPIKAGSNAFLTMLLIAFVAGFSERFIIGAVEKIVPN